MTRVILAAVMVVWCASMIGTLAQSLGLAATSSEAREYQPPGAGENAHGLRGTPHERDASGAATRGPVSAPTRHDGGVPLLALVLLTSTPAVANVAASEPVEGTSSTPGPTKGWATYCAPTPDYCQSWGGDARFGAVPSFRYGDEPYTVTVWYGERSTTVTVVSFCGCDDRSGVPTVIDLSPAAFRDLAPLSTGRISVVLVPARGAPDAPAFTLPPTDTEEMP